MPFVQPQLYPVPFTGGIDTKTASTQVLAGNLLALQNGVFDNIGQLNKRTGATALPTSIQGSSSSVTTGDALNTYNNECLLYDGTNAYTFLEHTQQWANKGTAISVITGGQTIARASNVEMLNPDIGFSTNIEVYAWEDSRGGVYYSVLDSQTGAIIVNETQVSNSGVKPKVISFNGNIFLFYGDGSNNLFYRYLNPNVPTNLTSPVAIIADGYVGLPYPFAYDVAVIGSKLFLGYLSNSDPTGQIFLNAYQLSGSLLTSLASVSVATGTNAIASSSSNNALNVVGDHLNDAWISWGTGTTVNVAAYTYTLGGTVLALTNVDTQNINTLTGIEARGNTGNLRLTYEVFASNPSNTILKSVSITPAGVVTSIGTLRSVGLASKAYTVNGNLYVNAAYQSSNQSTYFTLLLNSSSFGTVVGKIGNQIGGGLRTNFTLSEIPLVSTQIFKFANLVKGQLISEAGTLFTLLGVHSSSLNYQSPNNYLSVTQADSLITVGGILQCYDGVRYVEQNFHLYPEGILASASGSDGYLSAGTYQYLVTYEWMDNNGNIYKSTPSSAVIVSVSANNHVALTIPTLRLTAKSNVTICVYRSQVNGTATGITALANEVTSILAPLANDTTVDTVSFTDTLADSTILSNRPVYTSGGILPNFAPPASSLIALFQDSVWLAGLEDPNTMYYSQTLQNLSNFNTTPTQFCAALTVSVDPLGGAITAIKAMDQNLIIFKATNLFILSGSPPSAAGQGGTYASPQLLASDVGTSNPNSVALTPLGLLFQSHKGMYLLDRSLNVSYIGAQVQDFNDLTITSTVLVADKNRVIFTTTSSVSLVYDYYVQQWSTFTNQSAVDAIIFQDQFTYVQSNGRVLQSNDSFTDNGAPISMSWTSPNFSFAQLNGFQRVFRVLLLGTYKGPHQLLVEVAYDNDPVYTQSVTVTPTTSNTIWGSDGYWGDSTPWGGQYVPYEFRIDFNRQVCTSIRIRVSDAQSSDYNEGYSISAMTFEVGILPGGNKVPAAQTYGTK